MFHTGVTIFFLLLYVANAVLAKRGSNEVDKSIALNEKDGFLYASKTSRSCEGQGREAKRKRLAQDEHFEDISMETVAQIIATIDDPNYMTGPDVNI